MNQEIGQKGAGRGEATVLENSECAGRGEHSVLECWCVASRKTFAAEAVWPFFFAFDGFGFSLEPKFLYFGRIL